MATPAALGGQSGLREHLRQLQVIEHLPYQSKDHPRR
jgi:hypothetical protein